VTEEAKVKIAMGKAPSVMVATPMYGGMCTGGYVHGLLHTAAFLKELGVTFSWAQITNESLITRARNELARLFLDRQFDYLMFIDADISFDGRAVATLLAADEDIVCGVYPKKEIAWDRVIEAARSGAENPKDHAGAFAFNILTNQENTTDERGIVEIRHGATGFMLIKRTVFETLMPHVPTYRIGSFTDPNTGKYINPLTHEFFATSIDSSGALLSEDYHFCELWRKHGGKVHANPFIQLQHTGTYTYTGNLIVGGANLK